MTNERVLSVSVPYGITLLSNSTIAVQTLSNVSVPYGITLLSNDIKRRHIPFKFQYLMELHYSQTHMIVIML